MSDYIKREDALNAFGKIYKVPMRNEYYNLLLHQITDTYNQIKNIPAADVSEQKHGRWNKAYLDHEAFGVRPTVVYCSECNLTGYWEPRFCPNCGARMDGE